MKKYLVLLPLIASCSGLRKSNMDSEEKSNQGDSRGLKNTKPCDLGVDSQISEQKDLFSAVKKGDIEEVEKLLKDPDIDVNKFDMNHYTALGIALQNRKRPDIVELLLKDKRVDCNLSFTTEQGNNRPFIRAMHSLYCCLGQLSKQEVKDMIKMIKPFLKRDDLKRPSYDYILCLDLYATYLKDEELSNLIKRYK